MPGKPRKKATKPRKQSKLDQILLLINRRFDDVDKRFEGMDKRFDGVEQRLDGHDKRFEGIEQRLTGHDKRFESLEEQIVKLREENLAEHNHDRQMMLKLHDEQSGRIEKLQGDFDEFRNFVYNNLDALRGEYDTSRQERIFASAGQDRMQKEIEDLKQSDEKQNEALDKLDDRVTQLELNKAA